MLLSDKSNIIKELAQGEGFDACGITHAAYLQDDATRLKQWLVDNFHADMNWMENYFEKRTNPSLLVENSKSVVVVLLNYFPERYPFENADIKVARYALGIDYHDVIKEKLHRLLKAIQVHIPEVSGRAFVDSAPVMERVLARNAGLGWIGKNSLLLNNTLGSYFFIGELILNIELAYDKPLSTDFCGSCNRCAEACPTKAIVRSKVVDSTKCISYQTIENKGAIAESIQAHMSQWVFGCDICQEVCPWNTRSKPHKTSEFELMPILKTFNATKALSLTPDEFNVAFKKSPLKRAKLGGLQRNVRAACASDTYK